LSLKLQLKIVLPLKFEWNTSLEFTLFHSNMETANELCFILAFLKTQPLRVEKSKKHCLIAVSSKLQFPRACARFVTCSVVKLFL
jgi:hypothetical protein